MHLKKILDFIFPKYCLNCHKNFNTYLCQACFKKIPFGGKIRNKNIKENIDINQIFSACQPKSSLGIKLVSYYHNKGVKDLGTTMANFMQIFWQSKLIFKNKNYILIPYPEKKLNVRQRGFHASLLLTKLLAYKLGYSYLKRINYKEVSNKDILIISDYIKNQKKLKKISSKLRKNQAKSITVFVFLYSS